MRTAAVIIASTRAAAGIYPDRTGPVIAEWLTARGFQVSDPEVVADGPDVERALRGVVGMDLVITSGGTGISPTDRTPQATATILDYEIPGLASAIRQQGSDAVPTAVLSRGLVGVAGRTLVVNLPGSRGGVSDGLVVLDRVLDHALDQLSGGDHQPAAQHQQGARPQHVGHQREAAPASAPGDDSGHRPAGLAGAAAGSADESLDEHRHRHGDSRAAGRDVEGGDRR